MNSIIETDYSEKIRENFQIFFICTKNNILFEWKPAEPEKNYDLMMNIVRINAYSNNFFRINDGNTKIVSILKKDIIYAIGAKSNVQYQLVEAFLELLIEKFLYTYNLDVLLTFDIINPSIFKHFNLIVEKLILEFNDMDLVRSVNVMCNVCKKPFKLIVKKNLIKNSEFYPVPVVYGHIDHNIICYIDKNFVSRGSSEVNFG